MLGKIWVHSDCPEIRISMRIGYLKRRVGIVYWLKTKTIEPRVYQDFPFEQLFEDQVLTTKVEFSVVGVKKNTIIRTITYKDVKIVLLILDSSKITERLHFK